MLRAAACGEPRRCLRWPSGCPGTLAEAELQLLGGSGTASLGGYRNADAGESYRRVADFLGNSEATLGSTTTEDGDSRSGRQSRPWSCRQLLGLVASSHFGSPFGLSGPSCPSSQMPLSRSFCPARQFQSSPCPQFDWQFGLPKIRQRRVQQPVGTSVDVDDASTNGRLFTA
jgi:hypothetical protein